MEENKLEQVMCGCGRSSTGYCTGLHNLTEEEYEAYLLEGFNDAEDSGE